ncbi:MAG TPA: hypothetical protein DIC52_04550 [Candidatus Latescibacteria bacterium]|nr:hypothetical protein [Candidatus Latescibacterota bacterium]
MRTAGESAVSTRLRTHLPRLADVAAADIVGTEVSLQEAQHVIASEYGLKSWTLLQAVVKPDFDLLADAEDGAIQILVRSLSQENGKVLLSARPRHYAEMEMIFLEGLPDEEIEDAQRLVMRRTAELAVAGELRWPSAAGENLLAGASVACTAAAIGGTARTIGTSCRGPQSGRDRRDLSGPG